MFSRPAAGRMYKPTVKKNYFSPLLFFKGKKKNHNATLTLTNNKQLKAPKKVLIHLGL